MYLRLGFSERFFELKNAKPRRFQRISKNIGEEKRAKSENLKKNQKKCIFFEGEKRIFSNI